MRTRPRANALAAAFLVGLVVFTSPAAARAARWSGFATIGEMQSSRPFGHSQDGAALLSASAGCAINEHLAIECAVNRFRYALDIGIATFPEFVPPRAVLTNTAIAIQLGVRWTLISPQRVFMTPYAEFSPALFVTTWEETLREGDLLVEDSFDEVIPGFTAGAGFSWGAGSLRVRAGFTFFRSADIGHKELGAFSSREFLGYRDVGHHVSIVYRP